MNFIKCGIFGLVVASASIAACGGSSSDDSSSKAGSGNSTSSGGSSSSTAGSTSSGGGKTSGTSGSSSVGAGGSTCTAGSTDPTGMMAGDCPDLNTCAQSKCKAQFDACGSATGVCADYQKCVTACNCNADCVSNCADSESAACQTCGATAVNCLTTSCSTEFNACLGGALGGDAGAGKTCKDLAACCKTLPMDQQMDCAMAANQGVDFACDLEYSFICTSN